MAMMMERVIVLLIVMSGLQSGSHGAVYKVGDSAGWTIIGNVDYNSWASPKTFHVGDTIIFEYNEEFHNVMRVTHAMYRTCNTSAPLESYASGNDSIKITKYGHHFFICGVPGHCQAGQKVDINVHRPNNVTQQAASQAPARAPSSSSAFAYSVPVAPAPAPSKAAPSTTKTGLVPFLVSALLLIAGYTTA
ncbi:mavicyanin-like [Arachis stenosperma]|uniref:mavicyanin-like n=1 Tax=Arachis stenosperma TaxID=217475 RepID=UPI0025AC6F0E|nr:mavicyanin-like [Arachis stenosperma]